MSYNLYSRLRALFYQDRLEVGSVIAVEPGRVTVALPDGATVNVLGDATVGDRVYIRGGAIEGKAPALTVVDISI